ncbi:MAG: hypothetical protein AAGF79_07635 [Pseudomonadota bacterium]
MRWLVLVFWLPGFAFAQSSEVAPQDLVMSVEIEDTGHMPFVREMVLITIKGIYRRHITRETLVQPDLDGFSWAQLGADLWREERLDGQLVKVFERRMALYPNRSGTIEIGPFRHQLTLTDEGDDWFDHEIESAPVTVEVAPAPGGSDWFFPARDLKVSDQWSNAPDQLKPGEGVLRVIRLEALGVTTEMIPPMPTLTSPSAMIFPHPEKRLVELTPEGPVTYAFWRWTIRPSNDVSTIVEPLRFSYYNTRERQGHEVTIGAQRVAYGDVAPTETVRASDARSAQLPGPLVALVSGFVFLAALVLGLRQRRVGARPWPRWLWFLDPLARRLFWAARQGSPAQTRRMAVAILRRDGEDAARQGLLSALDRAIFADAGDRADLARFAQAFIARRAVKGYVIT